MFDRRSFLVSGTFAALGLPGCSGGGSGDGGGGGGGGGGSEPQPTQPFERATGWVQMPLPAYEGLPPIGGNFPDVGFNTYDLSDAAKLAQAGWPVLLPPPGNQGSQPSCTAWAIGYGAATQTLRNSGMDLTSPVSPADLFSKVRNRVSPGACTQGSHISYVMDVLVQEGAATLDAVPYSDQQCGILKQARSVNLDGYSRVAANDVVSIRASIASGQPVAFGMMVGNSLMQLRGSESLYVPNGAGSGHAMCVIGYDDSKQLFKILNSWGPEWGDSGYFWISYADFGRFALDVCIPYVRISRLNELIAGSASTTLPSSPIAVSHLRAQPWGRGTPGSYGVGAEIGWTAPLAVDAASISVMDDAQNTLFTRNFSLAQIARGVRFGGAIPDGSAIYTLVKVTVSGRDASGTSMTLSGTTRPYKR